MAVSTTKRELLYHVLGLDLKYVPSDEFLKVTDGDAEILAPMPPGPHVRAPKSTKGQSPYIQSLYETPLFTQEQEVHQFRKYNYLKFKAASLRCSLGDHPSVDDLRSIMLLHQHSQEVRNEIITANLRLAVNTSRRFTRDHDDIFDFISTANESLMRAVEGYNYSLGFRFSTYAIWAITKRFYRQIPSEKEHTSRFLTGLDLDYVYNHNDDGTILGHDSSHLVKVVQRLLRYLNDREVEVIKYRFGIGTDVKTLKDIGLILNISKERVRQLEVKAKRRLAEAVRIENLSPDCIMAIETVSGSIDQRSFIQ